MTKETSTFESEREQADSLIAGLDLPPEVSRISTDFGKDETGDEALFVHLHLVKGAVGQRGDIKKITEFSTRIQILLMQSGITLFPYVYLDEAA